MRRTVLVVVAAALVVGLAVSLRAVRDGSPTATPSPLAASPSATSPTLTTAAPSVTATARTGAASPSATTAISAPAGSFVSALVGYAIDLKPPWHRAICGSSASGPLENSDGGDFFIAIPDRDFRFTDIGPNADHISVVARANPKRLTYREWKSTEIGGSVGETLDDVTFAGRPALLVTYHDDETFLVADGGYMYAVSHQSRSGDTPKADRAAIIRSFRFLTADEIRASRSAATPSPAPRSPEDVADVLADGFAKRDVSILARVASPRCVSQGAAQAGATSTDAQTYLEMLRDRFARGLTVEVRARPISGDRTATLTIRSTWREPGQPDRDTDLMITVDRSTAYWNGTITYFAPRSP